MLNILSYNSGAVPVRAVNSNSARPVPTPQVPGDSFQKSSDSPSTSQVARFSAQEAVAAATQLLTTPSQNNNPSVDIKTVQDQLTRELPDVGVQFLNTDTFGKLNGRLATEAELTAMMDSLKHESNIPFGYITDGCYARAHLMDESFRQHGINFAKMFVRGDLSAKNEYMEARWWYHVAPLVFVDDGQGNPQAKIIDPGFSDKPLNPEDWVKAMNQGPSIQVDLVDPEQYYPRRYDKPETFSESLPPAVSRMQNYAQRLWEHRTGNGQKLGEFVKPTWDKPGSGGDFEIGGERRTIFPDGVKSASNSVYYTAGALNGHGPLAEIHAQDDDYVVSAAWENRPRDFDPHLW